MVLNQLLKVGSTPEVVFHRAIRVSIKQVVSECDFPRLVWPVNAPGVPCVAGRKFSGLG